MAYVLGMNGKLKYGVAGATGATLMDNVRKVKVSCDADSADITTRASAGWKVEAATLRAMTIEFEMRWDTSDAGFTAIKNAFLASGAIALRCTDIEGGTGPDADFTITNFGRDEELTDAMWVPVTAKATMITRAPAWN